MEEHLFLRLTERPHLTSGNSRMSSSVSEANGPCGSLVAKTFARNRLWRPLVRASSYIAREKERKAFNRHYFGIRTTETW